MAWNNPAEIRVASNGQIYVAPVGTALPTSPTASLNAAFVGLGLTNEDGVTVTVDPDVQEFMSWQSRDPVRRELTRQAKQAAFALQQWNENTVPLAFGGGSISSPSAGVYRYDFPDETTALDERALIIDAVDGGVHDRFVFYRANATEAVESQFRRSAEALLPITMKVLAPSGGGSAGYFLTDDPHFAAGS